MRDESFAAFYAGTAPAVLRQVYALVGDLAEAQDVVQEAYARAWQRWNTVAAHPAPEAWVRTVAWRLAVSRWRTTSATLRAWHRHGVAADVPGADVDNVALVAALRRLPAEQRLAIVLHHLGDLTVEQVAAEVGAPVGTVKARLARGRATLAKLLDDSEPTAVGEGVTSRG